MAPLAAAERAKFEFPPTDEQERIAEAVLDAVRRYQSDGKARAVKVGAFAGTGKTATLKMIAHLLPGLRILYLAFNRAIKEEALEKFPKAVTCKTGHGLAYMPTKKSFIRDRDPSEGTTMVMVRALEDHPATFRIRQVAEGMGAGERRGVLAAVLTLQKWSRTADPRPTAAHVPSAFPGGAVEDTGVRNKIRDLAAFTARKIWEEISAEDSTLPIDHDMYLKAYALRKPRLDYDLILYDECQDANPVILELVKAQAAVQLYVGDHWQSIYKFRDATNAFEQIPGKLLPLTKSWRFGPELAREANAILGMLGEMRALEGGGPSTPVYNDSSLRDEQAILCRGNAGVIEQTIGALDAGRKVAVVGGVKQPVQELLAAYELWNEGRPKHPELSLFDDWEAFRDYAETDEGASWRPTVRTIEKYEDDVPSLCERLETETVAEKRAEVVVSTAHKAKGREWDRVRLADDFRPLTEVDEEDGSVSFEADEANLQYVAITRAMRTLNLAGMLEQLREDARRMGVRAAKNGSEEPGEALPFFDPPEAPPDDPPGAPTLADLAALRATIGETRKLALEMWAAEEPEAEQAARERLAQLEEDMHASRQERVDAARRAFGEEAGRKELGRMLEHALRG